MKRFDHFHHNPQMFALDAFHMQSRSPSLESQTLAGRFGAPDEPQPADETAE
jgi:hypothetical protein